MEVIIYGFLGCGGLATLAWFITSKIGEKSDIHKIVHKVKQKIGLDNIKKIENKQKPILKQIKESEKLTKETKEKIKDIKKEANKEIVKILSGDKGFPELLEEEQNAWDA